MLKSDIRQFVSLSSCKKLEDMIARAREKEAYLEMERKGKPDGVQIGSSGKNPKVSDQRSRSHQGHSRCGKMHEWMCRAGTSAYFKCD